MRSNFTDEKRLVKALKAGKPRAQRALYEKLAGKMMVVCMRYARNREEAEDILQEGFVRVFRKIGTYQGTGSFEGWVRKVFSNVAIRHYQRNSRIHVVVGLDEVDYQLGESVLDQQYDHSHLMEMVQRLPDGYRMVFNLYAIEGYSHDEISQKLEISVGTSKSQLSRARKALQTMIEIDQNMNRNDISNG